MAWIISRDVIGNGEDNGVKSADYDILNMKIIHKFRMYDDDGELYYEGFSDDNDSEEAFAPLDDFGCPNAGCVDIRYLRNGVFESL